MDKTPPLEERLEAEYRKKFGLCQSESERCDCFAEIKWLRRALSKIRADERSKLRELVENLPVHIVGVHPEVELTGKQTTLAVNKDYLLSHLSEQDKTNER